MQEITKLARDKINSTFEKIEAGDLPETELKEIFSYLATFDYRNEYQKKVDYYIEIFAKGAMRSIPTDPKTQTATNSKKIIQKNDTKYYCELFIKEHFVHVQKEFWKKYKTEQKKHMNIYPWERQPIPGKDIVKICQSLKTTKKK